MKIHQHRTHRTGWLRAGVLGANDGLLSISSLLLGVAATNMKPAEILLVGFAGLVAGAFSMGAGEFVSVSSQADTERADLEMEKESLRKDFNGERTELRDIYIARGLDRELAEEVARQLMASDALGAHARDEIGITDALAAKPLLAAAASCISFVAGGLVPIIADRFAPTGMTFVTVATVSLFFLVGLGAVAAKTGGSGIWRSVLRVTICGALAMGLTAVIGTAFSVSP